jgi:VIT1/CCC1 family predicted Fe2+/Mn2+ transporter
VLGANDGLISTSALVVGVAAADSSAGSVLVAGLAGLVGGALSMAAGEYVSVSSQADTERADTAKEKSELLTQPEAELQELTGIYERRGLSAALARQVATELTAHDALSAHLRDELGIHQATMARPIQASLSSAVSFCFGAALPILLVLLWKGPHLEAVVGAASLVLLAGLGALAAQLGGAPIVRGALRVLFWGALAMAFTAGIGKLTGGIGVG